MTNKEAIARLEKSSQNLVMLYAMGAITSEDASERIEANRLAIEALKTVEKMNFIDNLFNSLVKEIEEKEAEDDK